MFFTPQEIQETSRMFSQQNLDIRTITLGISLRDCISHSGEIARKRIYDKITRVGENLSKIGDEIALEYGIPIINKRISVTPMAMIAEASEDRDYVAFARTLDQAAKALGINFLGGYSALVQKGCTRGDTILMNSLPEALAVTDFVCGSVNVGSSQAGINMDAVRDMGKIILQLAHNTRDRFGIGCAKLVVFSNAVEDNPFMAGAFHGPGEPECAVNVGLSGPGVIKSALENLQGASFDEVAETIKKTAFKITRMGELVAREASRRLKVPFGIIDLSLAPTPAVGDSVARIFQELGLEAVGAPGSTAALALLNDAVKKGGIMASSHVGGLSGAFIPVTEDEGMVEAVQKGALNIEKLEAMTCVCSVGLDMIVIPGETSPETISGILADEAAIGVVNHKTTGVRLIPAPGKKAGDWVEFGGLLGAGPVMKVNSFSNHSFIHRGSRIPAPIHSFKN